MLRMPPNKVSVCRSQGCLCFASGPLVEDLKVVRLVKLISGLYRVIWGTMGLEVEGVRVSSPGAWDLSYSWNSNWIRPGCPAERMSAHKTNPIEDERLKTRVP